MCQCASDNQFLAWADMTAFKTATVFNVEIAFDCLGCAK